MKKYLLLIGLAGVVACAHFTAAEAPDASDDSADSGQPDVQYVYPPMKRTYTVSTLAGTGDKGATDGPGTTATFNSPQGIAIGLDGSLYVADFYNNKIRKIAVDGTVSTYAGAGNRGLTNGSCATATFYAPVGVAVDAIGNVYVADYGNHAIRTIFPAPCQVTTLAGSGSVGASDDTGTAATFNGPAGLTLDINGDVYVADYSNNNIRKVKLDGTVTTIAGSGTADHDDGPASTATFNSPRGIAADAKGTLYVVETSNADIRKITTDGQVTTLAGSGAKGPVIDGTGTNAAFYAPNGVTSDANGNLFVADSYNNVVRYVSFDGKVTTIAGQHDAYTNIGEAGADDGLADVATFNYPSWVTVDPNGVIYVADTYNNKIRKLEPTLVPVYSN